MKIIRDFPAVNDKPMVLTIGNFDGVHCGHRRLIKQVRAAAAQRPPAVAAALTFEPHPLAVLRSEQPLVRLGTRADKMRRLRSAGIEQLHAVRFTPHLAAMDAESFAALLFEQLAVCELFVGNNFRFGRGGRGDFALLEKIAARYEAVATAIPLLTQNGTPVSSSRIRTCLQNGDFTAAAELLGRPWQLSGRVIHGDARGRQWGYPTANLNISFNPPIRGIFAARAVIGTQHYTAAVSIGSNPTVSGSGKIRVEAHLLDFADDIYGKPLTLQPLHKLREEKKYPSTAALADAIAADVARTREIAG